MGNDSVPKFIFHLSRFPVYRGSVLGRFYCITMSLEHWCNEIDRRKPYHPQNNLTQWNAVHHKVQKDWAGIQSAYARSHCSRLTNVHSSANRIETAVVGSLNWFKLSSTSHRVLYSSLSTLPNLMCQNDWTSYR